MHYPSSGECPCGPLHESLESQFDADDSERIVDGGVSKEHAHPWQVKVYFYEDFVLEKAFTETYQQEFIAAGLTNELKFIQEGLKKLIRKASCGGSIMTVRYVMTAAHCIQGYYLAKDIYDLISMNNFGLDLDDILFNLLGIDFTKIMFNLQLTEIDRVLGQKTGFKRIYREEDIYVRVGMNRLPTSNSLQNFDDLRRNALAVRKIKSHEKFREIKANIYNPDPEGKIRNMEYDYAILTLTNALKFTQKIQPVCLPHTETDMFVNRIGIISGYGTTENGDESPTLKEARMKVWSNDDCTAETKKIQDKFNAKNGQPPIDKEKIKIQEYKNYQKAL